MSSVIPYRLALDLGATSIGWAMFRLSGTTDSEDVLPIELIKAGVRIFSDGRNAKDKTSLAVTRRLARQMRRRRDRLLKRKQQMLHALMEEDFFPADAVDRQALVRLDPYELRRKGLYEPLTPAEFGRALFHLNQRRGFQSNRKTDKQDKESGILKTAIAQVRGLLAESGEQTVGEWLAKRHDRRLPVRARLRSETRTDDNGRRKRENRYDLYIDRAMVAEEFDLLWQRQAAFHPDRFTESAHSRLRNILLYQRPLKPVQPGRCTLMPEEPRAPLAHPLTQRFRIYQEVNHLRLLGDQHQELPLSKEQRNSIVHLLESKGDQSFIALRKALKLGANTHFNLEDGKRDRLKGNATSRILAKKEHLGTHWYNLTEKQQGVIVEHLLNEEDCNALSAWLCQHTGCDEATAARLVELRLPEGYGNLSLKALHRIVPALQAAVIPYNEAVVAAGFASHSSLSHGEQTGEIMPALPYYGQPLQRHVGFGSNIPDDPPEKRYGRIANPTVHIGLNQIRIVVNNLIRRYGLPSQVVVEVARELKMGRQQREEILKEQAKRQAENNRWRVEIRQIIGGEPSTLDLHKMRLWTELSRDIADRRCPYTGEQISLALLFTDAVEIEHILPFSRTLDDSLNNKTVCLRRANRDKTNRTPYEAFGQSPSGYDYAAILERAAQMGREKGKRFAADGYERWLREDKDFLARALNDTAYLSRIAREYLSLICPPNQVWVVPGRLTAMLRGKYGLNGLLAGAEVKNRNDHRHHAIDAAVIGISDRSLLQRFAQANQQARSRGLHRLVEAMPEPLPHFRTQVRHAIDHIWVSHKPDHGYEGAMMEETAWGLCGDGLVTRRVRGEDGLRQRQTEKKNVIAISEAKAVHRHGTTEDGSPKPYKGYAGGSNFCMEITLSHKGKWQGTVISTYEAYQFMRGYTCAQRDEGLRRLRAAFSLRDGRPLIMRLHRGDMVRMTIDGTMELWRVVTMNAANGQLFFAPVHEANVDERNRNKEDSFTYLSKVAGSMQQAQARKVTVSPIGEMTIHRPRRN